MTRDEFVKQISDLVEEPVTEATTLAAVAAWDSMSAIGFVALADRVGQAVSPQSLMDSKTVADLLALVEGKLT